ncbi:MAG: hypothetical protein JXE07_03565 [Candidatus Aminicenantes bacterium]|nr:hypothetical protein [Candidatus Aminicenantes bacterium]
MKTARYLAVGLTIVFCASMAMSAGPDDVVKAKLPILTTSAGQSNDVTTVNIVLEEAGFGFDYCDVPDIDMMKAGVGLGGKESGPGFHVEVYSDLDKFPKGTPYGTVIFAIGASLKGMGASGLTIETEEARLKRIIEYAKQNNIFIIAVHVGGTALRGAPGSDNERMIDAVAPFADYLIVTKESNTDARFTRIAESKKIPLTEVDYALDLVAIMKQVFE